MRKRNKLGRQGMLKNGSLGTPNLLNVLQAARVEPLNHPLTIKLWPTVAAYINQHGGADFVRSAILEKLQRIADQPRKARCDQCTNLGEMDRKPFCLYLCAFLDRKLLRQVFSCDGFQLKKGGS